MLRPGGLLLAGFMNPVVYVFDPRAEERGELRVRFALPYADVEHLPADELAAVIPDHRTVEYSRTFDAQLGGQLRAGLVLTGFYEDRPPGRPCSKYFPVAFATRALRP